MLAYTSNLQYSLKFKLYFISREVSAQISIKVAQYISIIILFLAIIFYKRSSIDALESIEIEMRMP